MRQVGWLGAAASMYTQAAISRADVAAIFLSRKILLDTRGKDSMLLPPVSSCSKFEGRLEHRS